MKTEVIKHSAAIQIANTITLIQRQAWNVLLSYAYENLTDREEHEIPLKVLIDDLQLSTHNTSHLKAALKALMTTVVEWNVLGRDGEEQWEAMTLLAQAGIKEGSVTYAYAPKLRRMLYNPRVYAKVKLAIQCKFSSKHALALYEYLCDYRGVGQSPWVSLDEFKRLTDTAGEGYADFNKWRTRVLDVAVKEVNTRSDLIVAVTYRRGERGRITGLKFVIESKPGQAKAAPKPAARRTDRNATRQVAMPFMEVYEAPEVDPVKLLEQVTPEKLEALKKQAEEAVRSENGDLDDFLFDLLVRVKMKTLVLDAYSQKGGKLSL